MTWKFWKWGVKVPQEATRPASLGGHTGKRPADPDAKPPKTTGTLRPVGVEPPTSWPTLPPAPRRPVAGSRGVVTPDDIPSRDYLDKAAGRSPRQDLKDQTYGQIALQIAQLGTCCRLKVGCVLLTQEGRVAGMGYNGAGPGMPHCNEGHCNENCRCIRTLHAEQNALFSRTATPYTAFVTHEPCLGCTKELLMAGVRQVRYLKPYTSIAPAEREARAEWIAHYGVDWQPQSMLP